ncbi:MAG: tetratricopeptide repeat protein, partial [Saprospiraceae bacterium]
MKKYISKYILLLFTIVIYSCHLKAQDVETIPEWKSLYNSLIEDYRSRDKDGVDFYASKIFASKSVHDSLRVTTAAIVASLEENEEDAFRYLDLNEEKLSTSKKDKNLLGWNYFYKGSWCFNNSYDKKALNYYYKADSVFASINRKSFMSVMTKVGISDVLMKSGFNEDSLIRKQILLHLEEGLRISDSLNHRVPKAIFLYKKGILYFEKGDLEKSESFYREALDISDELDNDVRRAMIFNRLTKIFLKRNALDSAIIYQEKAVAKAEKTTNFRIISEVNLELGVLYKNIQKYDDAIRHLDYAHELLEKSESARKDSYHDIEYNLAQAYFGKNEFKKGYLHLKSAKNIMQEVQEIRNTERVEEIEAKYQNEKKEQEITLLKSENQLVEQEKTNQR